MKNILLVCLIALINSACATTQSQTVESNMAPPNKQVTPVQETPAPSRPSTNEIFEAARLPQTPAPTPTGIPTPIKDDDYTVTELNEKKLKKITLDRQPPEIIQFIKTSYHYEESKGFNGTPLKKINTGVEDRDLNHDGVNERIVMAWLFGDDEFPVLYIFKTENNKWKSLINIELGFPDGGLDDKVEFLSKPDKNDFDLMKVFSDLSDVELRDIGYYQVQDGKYKLIECHKIEGKAEKAIPCDK